MDAAFCQAALAHTERLLELWRNVRPLVARTELRIDIRLALLFLLSSGLFAALSLGSSTRRRV